MANESNHTDYFALYVGTAPENYERFFVPAIGTPLANDLIEVAALRPGERVLDVACGTGVVTRMAKARVGSGAVAGVDMNPGMFVQDKPAALREMRRVLVPSGRLYLSVVGPIPRLFAILEEALAELAGPAVSKFVQLVFSMSDPTALERSLSEAGFKNATARVVVRHLDLPPPAEFLWQYVRSTPLCAPIVELGDDKRTELERRVVNAWESLVSEGKLRCELPVITASGVA